MTTKEFEFIVKAVVDSKVHQHHSFEMGFIAITTARGRDVIKQYMTFWEAKSILLFHNIKF